MAKYRKKPKEIEAVQFTRNNISEVMKFTNNQIEITTEKRINGKMTGTINTPAVITKVEEKEWIIKRGDLFFACAPDIFEETYEKVGEE